MEKDISNILYLYNHNIMAFDSVLDASNNSEDKVVIIKTLEIEKSYMALRLAFKYKDKKILYISSSKDNPYLDINRDFPNLRFRTYQSLINLSREELSSFDIDLLIIDELHHLSSPVWGGRIDTIIDTHPDMRVFCMTSYTVRDRINSSTWKANYNLAKKYYEHYHNLEVPQTFKTINGYDKDDDGYNLGVWITNQRRAYKKGALTEYKIKLLKKIGMRFENKHKFLSFDEWYNLALVYYNYYHNLEVSPLFKTINGYEYDSDGYGLGRWVIRQRTIYKNGKLSLDKIKLLEDVGMRFQNKTLSFEEWYTLAWAYYNYYHDLEVPHNFKTINGYEYDSDGYGLGLWVITQRGLYQKGKLSLDKIKLLEDVGMRFQNKTLNFEEWYNLALACYNHYHDLEVPTHYKTINGYEEDDDGYNLGFWIANQRRGYKRGTISEEEVILLKEIGMRFENKYKSLGFEEWYNLALVYYNYYHNLEVPIGFKTVNGYEEDDDGYSLGSWISRQRVGYKNGTLSCNRIKMLEDIGMIWNIYDANFFKNGKLVKIKRK